LIIDCNYFSSYTGVDQQVLGNAFDEMVKKRHDLSLQPAFETEEEELDPNLIGQYESDEDQRKTKEVPAKEISV